jgi:lipoate-protein ligase A
VIVKRDSERMARLLGAAVEDVRAKVTSLEAEGLRVDREALVRALVEGYEKAMGPFTTR